VIRNVPPPSRTLTRQAAIVGIGETDFHLDYEAARARKADHVRPTPEALATLSFERALADAGLSRGDIDGVSVSYLYGGPTAQQTAQLLGLRPRHTIDNFGIMAGPLQVVCADIAAGRCDTVAMLYAVAPRTGGRQYGGTTYGTEAGTPASYYYYHPWGWSSQAAHWALACQHYHNTYGTGEEDLGSVALQLRHNARANANAVMQSPLTLEQYLASRYIVRPLHLFDLCLVNDGGICLIVRRADRCSGLSHTPVAVAGWGESKVPNDKLHHLVRERLRPQLQAATAQALEMASLTLSDVQHFEGYDASSFHLITQLEGCGFVPPGEGLAFCRDGQMAVGGALPVNTGGGMLSGAYMHGWNHIVEIVRQLRHEAGSRQISDAAVSMFCLAETDQVHPIVLTRGC
jgi:acetyl-CoA acetyltransferase